MAKNKKNVVVAVSGGFDPIHAGHIRLFKDAKKMGDRLVVILNNDNWLRKKKQHVFMPQGERKEIIEAIGVVDKVVLTKHGHNPEDMSIRSELKRIKPNIFANGGDRTKVDAANPKSSLNLDQDMCKKLGIKMLFNVGRGGKVQSSSWLLADYTKKVVKK